MSVLSVIMVLFTTMSAFSAMVPGNYWRTCRRCTYSHRVLSCRCTRRNGRRRWSSLRVSSRCLYVKNINGRLVCTQMSPLPLPPVRRVKRFIVKFRGYSGWHDGLYHRQCRRACRLIDHDWQGRARAYRVSKLSVSCRCY